MKKRTLSILAVLALLLTLAPLSLAAEGDVARIVETGNTYETLAEAFEKAVDGDTIELIADAAVGSVISVSGGKSITLDLKEFKVELDCNNALTVDDANLTVKAGNSEYCMRGTGSTVSMFLLNHGSLTLDSGRYISEALSGDKIGGIFVRVRGSNTATDGPYSTLNIADGVVLEYTGNSAVRTAYGVVIAYADASEPNAHGVVVDIGGTIKVRERGMCCYINGMLISTADNVPHITIRDTAYFEGRIYAAGYGVWDIQGGSFSGSEALSIKSGKITIAGGTYTATGDYVATPIANSDGIEASGATISITSNSDYVGEIDMTINGGTFISQNGHALYEGITKGNLCHLDSLNITAGKFSGAAGKAAVHVTKYGKRFIEGGEFSTSPKGSYLGVGLVVQPNNDPLYPYTVGESGSEVNTAVESGAPIVTVPDNLTGDSNNDADLAEKLQEATSSGLEADAGEIIKTVHEIDEQVITDLKKLLGPNNDDEIIVVVQPYLNIDVTGYDKDANALTLDISAFYNLIATTEAELITGIDTDTVSGNAVAIGSPEKLTVTEPVTIVLPLPGWYEKQLEDADAIPDKIFIMHDTGDDIYYYKAEYTAGPPATLTFTTAHGFSDFKIFHDSRTVQVEYRFDGGTGEAITHTIADVGTDLRADYRLGHRFAGWRFFETNPIPTTYDTEILPGTLHTVMTEALLDKLFSISGTLYATPAFTYSPIPTPTPKPEPEPEEGPELPFTDVSPNAWFYDAVVFAFDNGLMEGVSDSLFAPDMPTTRGMLITILWRLEGSPAPSSTASFTDLISDWYTNAVLWGFENGIITGYDDGTFRPDANIAREDMAVILRRYAAFRGLDTEPLADLYDFADAAEISDYAVDAIRWAYENGLITGRSETHLVPRGNTTRAELATVMMRFIESHM